MNEMLIDAVENFLRVLDEDQKDGYSAFSKDPNDKPSIDRLFDAIAELEELVGWETVEDE